MFALYFVYGKTQRIQEYGNFKTNAQTANKKICSFLNISCYFNDVAYDPQT
jgi:hypothetical protein